MTAPTVPGLTDTGLPGDASRILQLVADGLDAGGRTVPARLGRSAGDPPVDCELLMVSLGQRHSGVPGAQRLTLQPCFPPITAELIISLARTAANVVQATGEPVLETAIDADGAGSMRDSDLIWSALVTAACGMNSIWHERIAIGSQSTVVTEGGFVLLTQSVFILAGLNPAGGP